MIQTKIYKGKPKVTFKGSIEEIKQDFKMIMWSMIVESEESRRVMLEAIDEINQSVKQIEKS